jgi:hypothetical protein
MFNAGRGEHTPRHLRIFANRHTIVDFDDAETIKPHLNVSLLEGQAGVTEYPLRVAAFSSVNTLSLFFVRAHFTLRSSDSFAQLFTSFRFINVG